MTKSQIKKLAKFYSGGIVFNALGTGAYSELMTQDEHEIFVNNVQDIAIKLVKDINGGIESLNIGTLDGLVKHTLQK